MENISALSFFLGGSIAIIFLLRGRLERKEGDASKAKLSFKKAGIFISISIVSLIIFAVVADPLPPVINSTEGKEVIESKEKEKTKEKEETKEKENEIVESKEKEETKEKENEIVESKEKEKTKEVETVSKEVLKEEIKKDNPQKVEVKKEELLVKERSKKEEVTPPVESATLIEVEPSQEIEKLAKQIINDDLKNTTINKIDVNEHMGRNDGTYLVLPHLKWNVKNSAKTTMEMLEMYSDHLAAKLANDKNVSEITVFWEVPYHSEGNNVAKFMYERSGNGMAKVDKWSVLQ